MLQKCSLFRVAEVFFKEPTKHHYLLEISRQINLAHTSVKKHLETLEELGIIIKSYETKAGRKYPLFKANIDNNSYKRYKKIYNFDSLNELATKIYEKISPKSIVLFGSYSRGEDTEDSDIDLFVECSEEKINLAEYEKKLYRKIQLHFKKSLRNYEKGMQINIINGVVLKGYLE